MWNQPKHPGQTKGAHGLQALHREHQGRLHEGREEVPGGRLHQGVHQHELPGQAHWINAQQGEKNYFIEITFHFKNIFPIVGG